MITKFKLTGMEGQSSLVGIVPAHVVSIQAATVGCVITCTRSTYHVADDYDTAVRKLFGAV